MILAWVAVAFAQDTETDIELVHPQFSKDGFLGLDTPDLDENGTVRWAFMTVYERDVLIAYETTPGKKVFMSYGYPAADFMLAELAPGKTYYAIVRPNWGTGGFAPTPIRAHDLKSSEAQGWVTGTKLIEADPKAVEEWMAENKQRMLGIYSEYWTRFERKTASEKAERTLLSQDGQ